MSAGEAVEQFRAAMVAAGLTPPESIEADGALHRFASNGAPGDDAGYYRLHLDGIPAGHFGCWRADVRETWRADPGRKLTAAEAAAHTERIAAMKRERDAVRLRHQDEARATASRRWQAAKPADPGHPYLVCKGVQPHFVRQEGDLLLVPVRDAQRLHSLQTIDAEGEKRFLVGGRVAGCYHGIGKAGDTVCIAEGYATGATIHEATGLPVAIAFNAGNLEAVARALRERFPRSRIVLCADDDAERQGNPGLTKAREAARAVGGVLAVPDFGNERPTGATDFNDLARYRGAEVVRESIERAGSPEEPQSDTIAPGAAVGESEDGWPAPMDKAALHGIAGEVVRMIEPDTEADPAAILIQFLAAFGALVGRGPHYRVEADQHHSNLFAVLVGQSSKARKGTSWGRVRDIFSRIDGWKPDVKGLSTGEGLKFHVRDAREETTERDGERVTEVVDQGVADKRLFVVEPEFASVLRATQRQGNTLSSGVRDAWDSGTLRTLTRNDPITATGAHIAIIGHITADELRAELTGTDAANGFANRFLFVAVRRSKLLPHGGDDADEGELHAMADRLRDLASLARIRHRIQMSEDCKRMWETVYPRLSEGAGGLHGAVTARAEAQTIRLALIYCLLDGADRIEPAHLMAALAVWTYCDATARNVFGSSLGDRIADQIVRRLEVAGDTGLTRTQIRDAFGRHVSGERIGAALELLKGRGRAAAERVETDGRPTELWRAVT